MKNGWITGAICILIAILSINISHSQLSITSSPTVVGTSTGTIQVVADGSAGPFSIDIVSKSFLDLTIAVRKFH